MRRANLENQNISYGNKIINAKTSPQDRSYEFQSVVSSLTGFGINRHVNLENSRKNNPFSATSKKVKKDIYLTSEKLKKLNFLIESKSSKNEDINKLVEIIKQDVSSSTNQLSKLQQTLKMLKMNTQYLAHSNAAIMAMQYMLGSISTELKSILETKHKLMLQENNSQNNYEGYNRQSDYTSLEPRNNYQSQQNYQQNQTSKMPPLYLPYVPNSQSQAHSQHEMSAQHQQQDQMLRHRAAPQRVNEIRSVEQTIVELGNIFQQLAEIVQDQDYVVNRIDSHMDMTQLNVESAHSELTKYLRYVSTNRAFYIKIFIVLILTFVGIIYILK